MDDEYEFEIEHTNFNVRVRRKGSDKRFFEAAVNCVVADHVHAVTKALSPEKKFKRGMGEAFIEAINSLGFVPRGYRAKTGEWKTIMQKEKLPNPSDAKGDDDHIKFAKHSLAQIEHGHYGVKNISVSQTPGAAGETYHSASWTTFETDPAVLAADSTA